MTGESIEIKSVHRESEMRAKLNHVKMIMMMVKLYIRYISADLFCYSAEFCSLLSASGPAQGRVLQWLAEMGDERVRFRASED